VFNLRERLDVRAGGKQIDARGKAFMSFNLVVIEYSSDEGGLGLFYSSEGMIMHDVIC
jgi:hypothetical protein